MSDTRPANPAHHDPASPSGSSLLHVPHTDRSQSSHGSHMGADQSKSRASTRQSYMSGSSINTNLTSVSALSANSSSIKPSLYPTSGYPISSAVLARSYPGTGYPVSHLQHSYGYPSSSFPCCEIPGVHDLGSQQPYPSSQYPGGGGFPGEFEQEDGSQPFIAGFDSTGMYPSEAGVYPCDPLAFSSVSGGFAPSGTNSFGGTVDTVNLPGAFDPHYNMGYPM